MDRLLDELAFCSNYLASQLDAVREFEAGGLWMVQYGHDRAQPPFDRQRRASLRVGPGRETLNACWRPQRCRGPSCRIRWASAATLLGARSCGFVPGYGGWTAMGRRPWCVCDAGLDPWWCTTTGSLATVSL